MFQIMIFLAAPDVSTGRGTRNNTTTTLEDMKKFFSSGEMLVDSSEEEDEHVTKKVKNERKCLKTEKNIGVT